MASASLHWVGPVAKTLKFGMKFYENDPHRPAKFSTKSGTIPKRQLQHPPPPPIARSDVDADIRNKASSLRKEFPGAVRDIDKPLPTWNDLHNFFDAVDLWSEGAVFLFYVINHIANENKVLNYDLEKTKLAEIRDWAKLWLEANMKRVFSVPPTQDLISIFDDCERECIYGLDQNQLKFLSIALNEHRKEHEHFRALVEEERMQALAPSMQQMQQLHQPDSSFHPVPHHQMQISLPMMPPGMAMIPHGQPMTGRVYPMPKDDSRRNQMMLMQPMPPIQQVMPQHPHQHTTYEKFMGNRGQVNVNVLHPMQGELRQDTFPPWDRRQRGWSNETGRNGRGRGANNFGHQNRSNYHTNDRRMANDRSNPRGSPLRRVSQNQARHEPIYVHDSQRRTPSFDGDATPRASVRGVIQNNQRLVSDPSNNRTGFSNDARAWQPSDRYRSNSKPQEMTNGSLPLPPFDGHPQAVINHWGLTPSCTFWYEGEARRIAYDSQNPRTVFVARFQRNDFEKHELKDLFAQFGRVESINFLYTGQPRAFIAFLDEISVDAAINGLNDHIMPSGDKLFVGLPHTRPRSDSQASEYPTYGQRYRSNSTVLRDSTYHGNSHRGPIRNQSLSYRAPSFSAGEHNHGPANASEASSPTRAPLTEGFQAQLQPDQPFPVQQVAERLNSSMAEVVQHQAAISRFSNQNQIPLSNIENRTHSRNFSNGGIEQPRLVMSQGSHNRKENSPMTNDSAKSTPFTSPKKDSPRSYGGDIHQKGNGGKNRKKANKQTWSNRQSRGPSPIKNNFEDMVLATMAAEQKNQQEISNALKVNSPIVDTPKAATPTTATPKRFTPEVVTPKPDPKTKSTASAKNSEAEDSITAQTGDENAGSFIEDTSLQLDSLDSTSKSVNNSNNADFSIAKAEGLETESFATTAEVVRQVPEVLNVNRKSTFEQPTMPSPKPDISSAEYHKSIVKERSSTENVPSPAVYSNSQTGEVGPEVGVESKPKKKSKKKTQKRKSTSKSDAGQSTISLNSNDSSETLKSSFMTENSEQFVTARSSPNPSHTSGPSDACLCAADTTKVIAEAEAAAPSPMENKRQDATNHSKSDSIASAASTPKSAVKSGKKSRQSHSKTDSSSTISAGSVRKSEKKSKESCEKTDENAQPAKDDLQRSQKETQPSSPTVNLDDPTQWPTLGSSKAPLTADSKSAAAPAIHPLSERKKNPNATIVPAVPLNMQPRRRPSIDSLAWPIVKKCDMK